MLLMALQNQLQQQQLAQAQRGSPSQAGLGGASAAFIQAAQMQPQQPSSQAASSNQGQLQLLQQLQMLQQLAQNQNQASLSQQQQQQQQSFGQGQDAVNGNSNKRTFHDDHLTACVPKAVASVRNPAKVARRTMYNGTSSAPSSAAPNSRGTDGGTQHRCSVSNGITTMDTCMDTIPEDSGEKPVPSLNRPVRGPVLVPCRARGLPVDHNFKVCL
jgi:hypothetical protein